MTVEDPPGVLNVDSTDSAVVRHLVQGLLGGAVGAFAGGISASNGGAHGVCGTGALLVTQSGTPGMSVKVAKGIAFITGTASALQGPYSFYNDADVDVLTVAAADATNPRKDLVIAQVRDATYDGTGVRDARLAVVTGTPAASPADPSLSSFPNALVLARVDVPALDTSITNAQITDLRTFAGRQEIISGLLPVPYASAGSGATSQTFATKTQVANLTAPAIPRASRVLLTGLLRVEKSNAADFFQVTIDDSTTDLAIVQTYQGTTFEWCVVSGWQDVAANTAKTYRLTIQRIGASAGTASVIAGPANNNLTAVRYPTP